MVLTQLLGLAIPIGLIGGLIYYRDQIFASLKLPEFDINAFGTIPIPNGSNKSELSGKEITHNGLDIIIPEDNTVNPDGTVSGTPPTFNLDEAEKQRLIEIRRSKGIGAGSIKEKSG